jgi:anaphase-promoting complex subunit 5
MAFLKQKAKDSRNWTLLSGTLLQEASLELCTVSLCVTYRPSSMQALTYPKGAGIGRSQEHLLQARFVNMQHDVMNMGLATALFQGASFERMGTHINLR